MEVIQPSHGQRMNESTHSTLTSKHQYRRCLAQGIYIYPHHRDALQSLVDHYMALLLKEGMGMADTWGYWISTG